MLYNIDINKMNKLMSNNEDHPAASAQSPKYNFHDLT